MVNYFYNPNIHVQWLVIVTKQATLTNHTHRYLKKAKKFHNTIISVGWKTIILQYDNKFHTRQSVVIAIDGPQVHIIFPAPYPHPNMSTTKQYQSTNSIKNLGRCLCTA